MTNRIQITAPLIASTVFLAIVALIAAVNLWGVLKAALSPGLGKNAATAQLEEFEQEHRERLTNYVKQFDGRSIFRTPNPTPPPRPPRQAPPPRVEQPKIEEPQGPPQPPPPPARYGGKSILFVVGDEVWFQDSDEPFRVRVGETVRDHTVIEVNAPRYVKIGWRGGEYKEPIFENWNAALGLSTTAPPKRPTPGLVETTELDGKPVVNADPGIDRTARTRSAAANLLSRPVVEKSEDTKLAPSVSEQTATEKNKSSDNPEKGPPE